jgi:hypothetical protein
MLALDRMVEIPFWYDTKFVYEGVAAANNII